MQENFGVARNAAIENLKLLFAMRLRLFRIRSIRLAVWLAFGLRQTCSRDFIGASWHLMALMRVTWFISQLSLSGLAIIDGFAGTAVKTAKTKHAFRFYPFGGAIFQ